MTETLARTIAIGDVHGCLTALKTLVEFLEVRPDDTLVMLGDVIDRGPDSAGALDYLFELRDECRLVCLLGNHEQMLLDAVDGAVPLRHWMSFGGAETLDSYRVGATLDAMDERHVAYIRTWGDYYEISNRESPGYFFAHGNYEADLPLDRQPWEVLRWRSLNEFTPARHCSGKTAVLGHTSNKQGKIVNLGHLVCIDTYCYGGKWLTAYDPIAGQVWQANENGKTRTRELPT